MVSNSYIGVEQTFGLTDAGFDYSTGTVTATAGNYWDLLWPQGTNTVSLGLVVSTLKTVAPQQVCPVPPSRIKREIMLLVLSS